MASSSATVRVEKATSDLLIGPDWTMNIEICDSINSDHWQAKDVVKSLKKRLQHKNPRVQFLTLTLLEAMMKNCGDSVHFQVVDRDILQEMVKIVKKKMDMQVRDKILVLLDSWQEAFGGPGGKYPQYYWAYTELRQYGIQFPQRSADAVPMFTPSVTHPVPTHPPVGYGMPSHSSIRLEEAMASEMGNLSISDLDSIRRVMELLSDMLQAVNVNDRMAVKDDVIVDLVGQCRSNQKKLMHLVNSTVDEELLAQGLALNDSLQMLLAKHDAIASGSLLLSDANSSVPSPNTPTMPVTVASKHSDDEEDEDDGFSQIARRNERAHVVPSQSSISTSGPEPLSDKSITTVASTFTGTSSSTAESSGSAPDLALALPDPPASVRTSTKEQDMIDLLSITLSTNPSPPHTPLTPPSVSSSGSHVPFSPSTPGYPCNPQPNPVNQGFLPYNSYVVPWAQQVQPHPQPQFQHQPQPHSQFQFPQQPQPQFQHQPQPQFLQQPQPQSQFLQQPQPQPQPQPQFQQQPQPQPQPQYQQQPHPQTQFQQQPQPQPQPQLGIRPNFQSPQPQISQHSLNYPPPPWANQTSAAANYSPSNIHQPAPNSAAMNVPAQSFRPMQQSYSFGRINNVPTLEETRANANHRQPATAKPFIPSYRLFEDLVDLRNPGGGLKTGGLPPNLSGPSNQNMLGRK